MSRLLASRGDGCRQRPRTPARKVGPWINACLSEDQTRRYAWKIIPNRKTSLEVIEASGVDWGYGPPGYLTPEQVAEAAAALADLTEEDLIGGVDQAELQRAEVYPAVWDRPGDLAWVAHFLPGVRDYFTAAAKNGDAVICWIS
ncbi:DUF1877 family protein [Micromonospora sp. NPDC048909]|uniref:DUF1877 family protein n=1 Tax=Micromonospora sp. NPDC048909 TaxID=3155643 RepID=UPI0034009634